MHIAFRLFRCLAHGLSFQRGCSLRIVSEDLVAEIQQFTTGAALVDENEQVFGHLLLRQ